MKVYGSTLVHHSQAISSSQRSSGAPANTAAGLFSETDQLDISQAGELASRSLESTARSERLANIRAQIDAGTYETEEKLNAALDRLLDQLG